MLQLREINKKYITGELVQTALDTVTINFRDSEFVSVLGPSGSGKTTLLNIIGGLDRYDSGDLIINGISTKNYKDRDWDSYRNHSIGFVFQSYNLIPHLSILSNVELALTIGGVSKGERRKRAKDALIRVGLGDQLQKKPNQMSGGQMQRVAIARALVNDPDILLADEPTGALDTETGVQVLELLKEVAKDRLVVMVTHNSELAAQYSTRIVKLLDGKVVGDSDPFEPQNEPTTSRENKSLAKAAMSLSTSLSLSFNNLLTKMGRTLLTALAGSIGIIGIALILSLSTAVNDYISNIQKDTMTSYPITISAETIDVSGMMGMRGAIIGRNSRGDATEASTQLDGVYTDNSSIESSELIASSILENDLTAFKKYLDEPSSEIHQYLGENGVVYSYDVRFAVYSYDSDGNLINSNSDTEEITGSSESTGFGKMINQRMGGVGGVSSLLTGSAGSSGAENFEELMPGANGVGISQVTTDSYDLLYGEWPESYDQVVLVLDEKNSVSTPVLYQLGLLTADEYQEIAEKIENGEEVESKSWNYEDVSSHSFFLVPSCDSYTENENGTFEYVGDNSLLSEELLENSVELKIVGVIRPKEGATNATVSAVIGYTSELTDYVIAHTNESAIVLAQEATPEVNVLTGMKFEAMDDTAKIMDATEYITGLGISDKASLYQLIMYYKSSETAADDSEPESSGQQMPATDAAASQSSEAVADDSEPENSGQQMPVTAAAPSQANAAMDETAMAAALDNWLSNTPDDEILISVYDQYIAGGSYEDNLNDFGKVSYDAPFSISIYSDSFEGKDAISESITNYNKTVDEDSQISYTDYVALLTSSLTSIVDVISYALIAFVAVSLIVSCLMIGIITHISVLERTKEIGILRALGASKRNISQVFNAETFIIGLVAGILGIGIAMLLTIPIDAILGTLLGVDTLSVRLPLLSGVELMVLSVVITVLGGLLPARNAANSDPVVALRAE